MVAGRVVRFDGSRGYGFIAPDKGGEDVFLHVNDLLIPESYIRTGLAVVFEIEDGDRGPKASSVQLAPGVDPKAPVAPLADRVPRSVDDDDQLASDDYLDDVTEALLESAPSLTGTQILQVRTAMLHLAKSHGWIG
ncbi:cold shock domain-containing protein [Kitasatospora sp. NA04385]|uniref:cold-shock protein n=1 Tax=Kitasatospora sp. NA04385 TaxID=2742135 RepID=UPI001590071B|nr:cold shock domain-containing protein [Kitasatospora sp. NA04385]QKW22452.1 cold shock domain-containing protein [Kitasatospora sp. NA04385]